MVNTNESVETSTRPSAAGGGRLLSFLVGQPRFAIWSRPRQAWESVGGALVTGVIAGLGLHASAWLYLLVVVVSFVGGAPAGAQHRTLLGAGLRAVVSGSVWAASVYAVHLVLGARPTIPLPGTLLAFLPWGFLPALVLAAAVWAITRRARSRGSRA